MRKGCLLAGIAFLLIAGLVLYSTRSLQINRGLKLDSYVSDSFTFDVWSYGDWIDSTNSGVHVSTNAPPYTLVLAIQPDDQNIDSIEILAALIVDKLGNKASVLEKLEQPIADVKLRATAAIKSPYAAFMFDSLLDSNESTALEIEFRTNPSDGSQTIHQTLEIQGFEQKTRSFVFWDVMSSV